MDRVFVTGANGLLGTNLVLMLIEQKYFVTALVRKRGSFIHHTLENLELVEGDLLHEEQLTNKMKGCRYVVHIAANTSQKLLKLNDYYPANALGTKNVINACIKNKIEKLIYIGTANTYAYGDIVSPGNENMPMKYPFTKSLYALSKNQAQEIIDEAASKLNITTISPTFMLGPFDSKPSSGRIILLALNKRFVFYPSGGKNFVHVNDVVKAIIKAFDLHESGQKYIIANENLSYKKFFEKLLRLNNQKTKLIPLPDCLLSFIGLIGDLCRFFKFKTDISSVNTNVLKTRNYYTNKKAMQELNIEFTPIDKAIVDSLEYFKQMHLKN